MSAATQDEKEQLREELRTRRREVPDRERREASEAICDRLEARAEWRSRAVAGYLSFDNEVAVAPFLRAQLERGRPVALPRVEDDEQMHYVEVDSLDDVREGSFGIREPTGAASAIESFELFLVPGVGFDRRGGRLGMGWGYYDRALDRRLRADTDREPVFVGVCYDCQLVDDPLPTEPHDVRMDAVVTRSEFLTFERG